jgi:hypothetical protein
MITLTITTKAGTSITLNIPEDGSSVTMASNSASDTSSAVATPDDTHRGAEGAKLSEIEPNEVEDQSELSDELVGLEGSSRAHVYPEGGGREGEVGEVGIGSLREREGEVERKGGGGNMRQSSIHLNELNSTNLTQLEWPTIGGEPYRIPEAFKEILYARYGSSPVIKGCKDAYVWLMSSPQRRKTQRGMGKFISGWLQRNTQSAQPAFNQFTHSPQKGGLLNEARNSVASW